MEQCNFNRETRVRTKFHNIHLENNYKTSIKIIERSGFPRHQVLTGSILYRLSTGYFCQRSGPTLDGRVDSTTSLFPLELNANNL